MTSPASSPKKRSIFVTRRWPAVAEEALAEHFDVTFNTDDAPLDKAALMAGFAAHDIAAPTVSDVIDVDIIAAAAKGKCRLIANYGVGVNHIDLAAAAAHDLAVSNTPDVLTDATADLTLTLMLMLCRRAGEAERELRAGEWAGWRPTHMIGRAMTGKTLGIIGMGRIGQAVAARAHFGFGMDICYYNRSLIPGGAGVQGRQVDSVAELCAQSDFVSLHCAATPATRHVLDIAAIAAMRPDAFVINTARGDVVDEDALSAALTAGKIAGAGLDVFQGEPVINPALLAAPNTVLLPHLGSATIETRTAMGMKVLVNARAFASGAKMPDMVG
ncbi:D-glycerate dehydrogenase [Alphaproteobacteria bacterium]|jgi:lactate dehydrogenase-like 2-hydroxyacid dehydrogenase|nr:D-glycerate dehydrogenase [Alphaproteobacteria bacterium]